LSELILPHQPASPFPTGLRGVVNDPRNLNHLALVNPPPRSPTPNPVWHRTNVSVFDQQGSSCTAQAAIGMLITLPYRYQFQPDRAGYDTEAERHQLYLDAQLVDGLPGQEPDYLGTLLDAPFRVLRDRGIVPGWDWLLGEQQLWDWLTWYGPAVAGTLWTEGMFYTDAYGYIAPSGRADWMHAYDIVHASPWRQAYRIVNSWSVLWGQLGRAWITRIDMAGLLAAAGQALTISSGVLGQLAG